MAPVPDQVAEELLFSVPEGMYFSFVPVRDSAPLAFVTPASVPPLQLIAPLTLSRPLPPPLPPGCRVRLAALEGVLVLTFKVPLTLRATAPSVPPGPVRFSVPAVTVVAATL